MAGKAGEQGGPIEKYLKATSMSLETFHRKVKKQDAAAVAVFAAEVVYGAVEDVGVTIENMRD